MGLTAILNSAVTGLNTAQTQMLVTANNVANVNTPGYARQKVLQETLVAGVQSAGVRVAEVRRIVDNFLVQSLRSAVSDASRFKAEADAHDRLQSLFGRPDQSSSLSGRVDSIFAGLSRLATDPSSAIRRVGALNDMTNFAAEVNRLSGQIQLLRQDVDRRIGDNVLVASAALKRIADLNPLVAAQVLAGRETSALVEQREQAVSELARILDVKTRQKDNGFLLVTTSGGFELVESTFATLSYTPQGSVSAGTRFQQIQLIRNDPLTGLPIGISSDFDSFISGGELRGLMDMRNTTLSKFALELGEFSGRVVDELNRVHNSNTSLPPPSKLVGRNTGLEAGDAHNFTGVATFMTLNSDNSIGAQVTVDFDAIGPRIADVIAAVNGVLAPTARFVDTDGSDFLNGRLVFETLIPNVGVAIVQDTNNPSQRAGRGFAHFFGLNDVMVARGPGHFETGLKAGDAHGFLLDGTMTMELRGPNNQIAVQKTITVGGTSVADLLDIINNSDAMGDFVTLSIDSRGKLSATPVPGFEDFRVRISSDTTQRANSGLSFSRFFGLDDNEQVDRSFDVAVRADIKAAPDKFALNRPDLTVIGSQPALEPGDPTGAVAFQNLETASVAFDAAGHLSPINDNLAAFGASILANSGLLAAQAEQKSSDRLSLKDEIESRSNNISGVNLDEELANMIIFQNAFNASARLIATVQQMFDDLMRVIS